MTRDSARRLVNLSIMNSMRENHQEADRFLGLLETLGLIEFSDKPKEPKPVSPGLSEREMALTFVGRIAETEDGTGVSSGSITRDGAVALARQLVAAGFRLIESKT